MEGETIVSLNLPEAELKILETMQKKGQTLNQVVQAIIKEKLADPLTSNKEQTVLEQEIEYQTFSVKIPKKIVPILEYNRKGNGNKTLEEIELTVVDNARSQLEALTGDDVIEVLELGPTFFALLGDEKYKPRTSN